MAYDMRNLLVVPEPRETNRPYQVKCTVSTDEGFRYLFTRCIFLRGGCGHELCSRK